MTRFILYSIAIVIVVGAIIYLLPGEDYPSDDTTVAEGKALFTKHCMSCHGLQEDGIGAPLGGITKVLSEKILVNFISDPSKAIESGEERARLLQHRYKLIMPSFKGMEESDIRSILAYLQYQTNLHALEPLAIEKKSDEAGLTGRLVAPVKKSGLAVALTEVVQLPRLSNSADLGVVTLRAHPSGDGTLVASDQQGVLYRVKNGTAEIFLDVRAQIENFQSGPGIATGVGSFDFHPNFLNNGLIYISHAETFKGQLADYIISDSIKSEVQWVISEWKMDDVNARVFSGTHRELLRLHAPTFGHGCQEIAFIPGLKKGDPDYGLLYIGYGDGGSNNIMRPELGHNLKSFLGTIMRIDPAGSNSRNGMYGIPDSNPFVHEKDPLTVKEIYAFGFRNPHRMAWDKANGNRMMATDIGESNIEELNIIEYGGDYGWPNREGVYGIATLRDLKTVFKLGNPDVDFYKRPFVQYDHEEGNAISGGYVYDGEIAALKNKYIFGDIVNGRLFYLNIDPQLSDSTIYELAIKQDGKETNLQEMSQTKRLHLRIAYDQFKKELYIITKADGKVRRVTKAY
ncbi:MAG: PQQ-dependent sugar dehydrogenase [Cyclobacteriaceae bacterium]|nr:PQQ-dependent sugar dehydrogenase [Cyclobacteriaceae bacterium]